MNLCSECVEVKNVLDIDIERMIQELSKHKGRGKELTDQEKRYLCLSLLGYEPRDIARLDFYDRFSYDLNCKNPDWTSEKLDAAIAKEIREIASQNIRPYLSRTINSYVKSWMVCEKNENMPSWSKVMYFLRQKGYIMIDLAEENKKEITIRLGGKPSDSAIVELLQRLKNSNLSIVFKEVKQDGEQND